MDKCLSPKLAKGVNRFQGFVGVSLGEVFTHAEVTEDWQFLGAAGEAGWAVFTQNDAMLRVPHEMRVIRDQGTRVFTLTNSQLGTEGAGLVFGRWLVTMRRRIDRAPGPCFWRLYEDRKQHDLP